MSVAMPWDVPGRVQGVDVSSAQPVLPWSAIAAAGCRFAIAKATEGHSGVDPMFSQHVNGARASGLRVGSYHFLHSSEAGTLQAERYFARIEKVDLDIRPVLDWEDDRRVTVVGEAQALDTALSFLLRLRALSGLRPIVYTGPGFMARFRSQPMLAHLLDADAWLAHYRWDPATGHDYGLTAPTVPAPWAPAPWRCWQCGGNGAPRIPGVSVDLDRDVCADEAAFADMLIGMAPPPGPTLPETAATLLASELDDPATSDTDPAPPDPHREDT